MTVIFGMVLILAACAGILIGGLAAVHWAEWMDEHGPKWWPGR